MVDELAHNEPPSPPNQAWEGKLMAAVVIMKQNGDTAELLRKYDIVSKHMMSSGPPPKGLIAHFCLATPDGMSVSNVWESEEAAQAGQADPRLREAFAKAEMPPPAEPKTYRVHNHFITSEMPTGG